MASNRAVVMPNHIHFLAINETDSETNSLRKVIRSFKGRTARLANQILDRKGNFWQRDWFDRWMRNETETTRVAEYIRQNPVKTGLIKNAEDWHWQL